MKKKKTIELISSINYTEDIIFYDGFNKCINHIKNTFDILFIENISHNNIILNNILLLNNTILETNVAYYTYNFIHKTINANDALIIC